MHEYSHPPIHLSASITGTNCWTVQTHLSCIHYLPGDSLPVICMLMRLPHPQRLVPFVAYQSGEKARGDKGRGKRRGKKWESKREGRGFGSVGREHRNKQNNKIWGINDVTVCGVEITGVTQWSPQSHPPTCAIH